ncbi:N-acetyl sugar amidotransferase [Pseudoalteromonas rubra]|uniref:N-acetyl sugar amidotransferase n=2 Tax=Pseudoalteromonas rubra TaxID=43658 RepID=A0A5S3WTC8_9GAMM|nr:N-acetyl sugar amidotransferase [Pseudoalteromonas rubra]TMP31451.1 N-acetyl sugar amidotransferase [Pseudoalteromonas rubra]TMP34536.1 N-acetyl sugar amidotransferase [Pseudoalteromonas rubra]
MKHQTCNYCVMDTTDPDITFNVEGRCNHCLDAEQKLKNGWFPNEKGKRLLESTAKEIKSECANDPYDCIIGVSGGVDSSYLVYVAVELMGLRPLIVHVDAGWNSEIAVSNIEKLVKKYDLELFTYVVSWSEIRDLQVAYLRSSLANQDVPQDHAFFAKLYEFADRNKIKYVITGSNLTSESILPLSWGYSASDSTQIKAIFNKFGSGKLKTYPMMSFFKSKIYWPYMKKLKVVKPLDWINYDKNKAINFLEEHFGWVYYGGKHHESKWTKFFQAYYLVEKFGFDKRKAHLSSLIVAGQISRDEALKELEKPLYDQQELNDDKVYIANKLNLSLEEFDSLLALENKDYKDYPNEEKLHNFFRKVKRKVQG